MEEALLVRHDLGKEGSTLLNKNHSISPRHSYWQEWVDEGEAIFQKKAKWPP